MFPKAWLGDEILDSQEGLYSVELVKLLKA